MFHNWILCRLTPLKIMKIAYLTVRLVRFGRILSPAFHCCLVHIHLWMCESALVLVDAVHKSLFPYRFRMSSAQVMHQVLRLLHLRLFNTVKVWAFTSTTTTTTAAEAAASTHINFLDFQLFHNSFKIFHRKFISLLLAFMLTEACNRIESRMCMFGYSKLTDTSIRIYVS